MEPASDNGFVLYKQDAPLGQNLLYPKLTAKKDLTWLSQ
jgi:hypothetical protein